MLVRRSLLEVRKPYRVFYMFSFYSCHADPLIFTTGPAIPTKGGTALLSGETVSIIIMPASQFMYKSVIISFEAYAEVAGSIEILVICF